MAENSIEWTDATWNPVGRDIRGERKQARREGNFERRFTQPAKGPGTPPLGLIDEEGTAEGAGSFL